MIDGAALRTLVLMIHDNNKHAIQMTNRANAVSEGAISERGAVAGTCTSEETRPALAPTYAPAPVEQRPFKILIFVRSS